ncbi:MAG: acyltransferase family protein [Eubacterium limosum]|nr:acyltransferase family protein [Eubacterium limosum]
MENTKKRNSYLDMLKGLLILIVVLRHIFQIAAQNSDTDYLCNLMAIIEMPLFIAISGYFCLPKLNCYDTEFSVINKIKKISKGYIIPFLSFYIIFRLFFYQQYDGINSIYGVFFNISQSLWYLFAIWMLNLFSIIAYVISRKIRNMIVFRLMLFCVIYFVLVGLLLFIGIVVNINFLGCKLIVYYSVYYIAGYLFMNYQDQILLIYNKIDNSLLLISMCVYFFGGYMFKIMAMPDNTLSIAIRFILALTGIIFFLNFAQYIHIKKRFKLLEKIGIFTLEIYYVHSFLMNAFDINKALVLFSMNGIVNSIMLTLCVSILCPLIIAIVRQSKLANLIIFGRDTYKFR